MNKENQVTKENDINTLTKVIMDFINTSLEVSKPYTEQSEMIVMYELPIVMELRVRRSQELYFITVMHKNIDLYNADTIKFINEGVCVNTYIHEKYLIDVKRMELFLNKIEKSIQNYQDKMINETDVTKFDIAEENQLEFFEVFNNNDNRYIIKTDIIDECENETITIELIFDKIAKCVEYISGSYDIFSQFKIRFMDVESTVGYTSFSIILNFCNITENGDITYMIADVITDEDDKSLPPTYPNQCFNGVAFYMNRNGFERSSFFYRLDPYLDDRDYMVKISNFIKELYHSINIISSSKKVKKVVTTRKEI